MTTTPTEETSINPSDGSLSNPSTILSWRIDDIKFRLVTEEQEGKKTSCFVQRYCLVRDDALGGLWKWKNEPDTEFLYTILIHMRNLVNQMALSKGHIFYLDNNPLLCLVSRHSEGPTDET